jgi:hypothetical protein
MTGPLHLPLNHLAARYLSLEELIIMEELLDLCGARIDTRALPLLRRRLQEEEAHAIALGARGYVRMGEKCEQLTTCIKQLIEALEDTSHGTTDTVLEA